MYTLTSNLSSQFEKKLGELSLKTLRLTHLGAANNKIAFLYLLLSPPSLSSSLLGGGGGWGSRSLSAKMTVVV